PSPQRLSLRPRTWRLLLLGARPTRAADAPELVRSLALTYPWSAVAHALSNNTPLKAKYGIQAPPSAVDARAHPADHHQSFRSPAMVVGIKGKSGSQDACKSMCSEMK